jgi:hypothetical protein
VQLEATTSLEGAAERLESLIAEFLRPEEQPVLILEIRRVHLGADGGPLIAWRGGSAGMALPEMPLEPPLQPAAHTYAHGGFLGAAFSMVADPKWAKVGGAWGHDPLPWGLHGVLTRGRMRQHAQPPSARACMRPHAPARENMHRHTPRPRLRPQILEDLDPAVARNAAALLQAIGSRRKPDLGPLMVLLDNSPILAAYGMVRSGCCVQSRRTLQQQQSQQQRQRQQAALVEQVASGAARAQAPARRTSPFQRQQQQQQQQMLMLMSAGDAGAAAAAHALPYCGQDPDTASVARALEMFYYGDQSGLAWANGHGRGGGGSRWAAASGAAHAIAAAAEAQQLAVAAAAAATTPLPWLSHTFSAPVGSHAYGAGAERFPPAGRTSMRSIAARHLPLLSARSLRASVSGEAAKSADGSSGCVRWGDVASMRAKPDDGGGAQQLLHSLHRRGNDFGYAAVAVEWDIWLSPKKPWDLARARIVGHGGAGWADWAGLARGADRRLPAPCSPSPKNAPACR